MTAKPSYEELERRVHELEKMESDRTYSKKALREGEALLRGMFKDHSAVMLLIDPDTGQIVKANQAASHYYGYPLEKMFQMKIQQLNVLSPAENTEQMRCALKRQANTFEFQHLLSDGQVRDVEVHSSPIKIQHQTLLFSIIHDITELKKTENVLREREKLLSLSQELGHIGSWKLDLVENCLTWSDEVYRIFGYEPQEFSPTYQAFLNAVHPDDRSAVDEAYSSSLREGSTGYEIEHRVIQKKSGEVRYVQERCIHESNNAGTIIQSTGMVQDITERKRAEKEIARRELTLNKIFDVLPIGLWFADKNGKLLRGNPAGVKIWGAEPTVPMEEYGVFKARRLPSGEKIDPDDWALVHTIQNGVTIMDELLEIDTIDGKKKIILNYTAPVIDDTGEMLGAIIVNNDITHHKQAEAEREKLLNQLSQKEKMESIGRLAGGVAHDFNNMLGVILGHTELAMLQADENHDLYSDLKEIQVAAKRSADITKQLLAFARKQTISPRQLDLNNTVESMLNMLRRLIGEDIDLVWKPAAHIWPVKMDPPQIDQILANLCINARDSISGVGKLTIESGRKTFDEEYCSENPGFIPGDFVLLAVSDNGCGMDKDTLKNLFEPFFTTKEVGKGTGLGLATVYGIVKQNNGFINVYSESGQGSTFKIYLPRLVADEDDKAIPDKKSAAGGTETILLVEDEPSILRMTRMMLERKGYSVLSAAKPAEAMEKATNHSGSIDLLMTDVVMPEMNGRDLAGQITDLYPGIRLLFMSGYTANVIAHQGVLDDGVTFIQKPFSMADMTAKVRELLDMTSDKNQG